MKEAYLLKVTPLQGSFLRFLNCINGTNPCKASHIYIMTSTFAYF